MTLTLDGLGRVPFWHDAPRWQGRPIVPFLQLPWTVIHRPRPARPTNWLRRQRIWRVSVRNPTCRLPRSPWVLADIVVLHPMKGVAAVVGASAALPFLPAAAPILQAAIWVWFGLLMLGLLRQMRLLRLRSALWLRVDAALAPRTRSDRRAHRA